MEPFEIVISLALLAIILVSLRPVDVPYKDLRRMLGEKDREVSYYKMALYKAKRMLSAGEKAIDVINHINETMR